jgi:hypothetical protein
MLLWVDDSYLFIIVPFSSLPQILFGFGGGWRRAKGVVVGLKPADA